MATQHTAGPWAVRNDGMIITQERTGPCSHEVIAIMPAWIPMAPAGHVTQDHLRANAHLIAAAPDLLAACEQLKANMDLLCTNDVKLPLSLINCYNSACAAIAKGKGAQ